MDKQSKDACPHIHSIKRRWTVPIIRGKLFNVFEVGKSLRHMEKQEGKEGITALSMESLATWHI